MKKENDKKEQDKTSMIKIDISSTVDQTIIDGKLVIPKDSELDKLFVNQNKGCMNNE